MSPNPAVLLIPIADEERQITAGLKRVELTEQSYPKSSRGGAEGVYNRWAIHTRLKELLPDIFIAKMYDGDEMIVCLIPKEDLEGWLEVSKGASDLIIAIQEALQTWILSTIDKGAISTTGYFEKKKLYKFSHIPIYMIFNIILKIGKNPVAYQDNEGQLVLAKELKGMNLGALYSLASSLGYVEQLGWTKMDVPCEIAENFLSEMKSDMNRYKTNEGQLFLAKKLKRMNLRALYTLASGFGYVERLGWTCMNVPYETAESFLNELNGDMSRYKTNKGQLLLAKELKGMNLGALYSLASSLGYVERLGWTKMEAPYETAENFLSEMESDMSRYETNPGQLVLAKKLKRMHLGNLYTLASGFGYVKQLGWTFMNVPCETAENFLSEMESDMSRYETNPGQLVLAKKLKGMHLGALYSLASSLGYVKQLGWTKMNVPCETAENFLSEMESDMSRYETNPGQLVLAKKLKGMNLGHLYTLASSLGYVKQLGWTFMSVPCEAAENFLSEMKRDVNRYKTNPGQLVLAEKLKGMNLGHLYTLASGFGYVKQLGWTYINVPYEKATQFDDLYKGLVARGELAKFSGTIGRFAFAQIYKYSWSELLGLAELYDFESVLNWRIRHRDVQFNHQVSLDDNHHGEGSFRHERIPDTQAVSASQRAEEQDLLALMIRCKREDKYSPLIDYLGLSDPDEIQKFIQEIEAMDEKALARVFE